MSKYLDKALKEIRIAVGLSIIGELGGEVRVEARLSDSNIEQIKQLFIEDGWVHSSTPQAQMRQGMSNLHARMKAEMIRLGMTPTPKEKI